MSATTQKTNQRRAEFDASLKQKIRQDIYKLSFKRAINAIAAVAIAIAEVGFSAAAVWYSGTDDFNRAAVFSSLAGFVTVADNSLRIRELASAQNSRIGQLREIVLQMDRPPGDSPFWGDYISVMTAEQTIDYLNSILALKCSPPEPEQ